jgi:hypothetical protein
LYIVDACECDVKIVEKTIAKIEKIAIALEFEAVPRLHIPALLE